MVRIRIDFSFLSMVAVLGWISSRICVCFLIAVSVHELGHILAVILTRGKIMAIRFTGIGAEIKAKQTGRLRKVITTISGPAAGFVLFVLCVELFPELAVVSLLLSLYNLLPLYPLDGGVILLNLLQNVRLKERIFHWVTICVCCALMVGACWLAAGKQAGLWPVFLTLVLLCRVGEQEKELLFCTETDTIE